jgi:hypothetical protein
MRYVGLLVACLSAGAGAVASCSAGHVSTFEPSGAGGHGGSGEGTGGSQGTGAVDAGMDSTGTSIDFDSGMGDGGMCTGAVTCAQAGADCGPIGDGCGGILQCGTCTLPEICGGMTPSVCGTPPCAPKTCAQLGFNCGMNGDGCGGTLDCGACSTPGDTCGGGGMTSVCGHTTICTPKTCAQQGFNCGMNGNGCGGTLDCGATCPSGQFCGGGGQPSVCGTPPCTPKTCAQLGANCGPVGNGCGGLLQCGACGLPKTCGGAGTASVCGIPPSCTNLCLKQVTCSNPAVTTTVSGTVYAPNGIDPLLNALVYVPNAAVQPFTPGVSCDNCGAATSGAPLVSAVTGTDGKFVLKNMPVGANIPLVIQLGRWRRQVNITNVPMCTNTQLPGSLTRLPKQKSEGDIPLIAFGTGDLDSLECVFRKIGVVDAEFSAPSGTGRIHLYRGNGAAFPGSPNEDALWSDPAVLNQYDMVLFPCQGFHAEKDPAVLQNMIDYADAGGRVFATHFSYVWLYDAAPFSSTANWDPGVGSPSDQTGYINTTFPKGQALAQWLVNVGATTTFGQIPLKSLRQDFVGVNAPTQSWMTVNNPQATMHMTFNTPVGAPAAQQCGRVLYDDFHVEESTTFAQNFPGECVAGAMTPQEKLLEFMIFDLGSCITPDIPICTAKTCAELGADCGPAGDGCGGLIQCGTCPAGQTCGGGGQPSLCGTPTCTAKTCAQLGIQCGPAGDGCGGLIASCGTCPAGQTCGGGGMPGVCGNLTCSPKTCAQLGIQCGPAGDGCGGLLQCGTCPMNQTCGGGGMAGICGTTMCTPKSCAQLGADCGPVGDGCGGIIMCGTCAAPQTCGGGGMASVCGGGGPH